LGHRESTSVSARLSAGQVGAVPLGRRLHAPTTLPRWPRHPHPRRRGGVGPHPRTPGRRSERLRACGPSCGRGWHPPTLKGSGRQA